MEDCHQISDACGAVKTTVASSDMEGLSRLAEKIEEWENYSYFLDKLRCLRTIAAGLDVKPQWPLFEQKRSDYQRAFMYRFSPLDLDHGSVQLDITLESGFRISVEAWHPLNADPGSERLMPVNIYGPDGSSGTELPIDKVATLVLTAVWTLNQLIGGDGPQGKEVQL